MLKKILFGVLLVSACGGDREVAVDPMSFMPRVPAVPVAAVAPIAPYITAERVPTPSAVAPTPAAPSSFDDALAQGRALAAKGERDDAKRMFEAAVALDKKRAEPLVEISRLYIAEGQRGLAIAAAKRGTKLAPLSSQAWNTQGRAELLAFDYDAAIEAFSRACELNQDNIWAWNNLGYTELQLKKYDEAAEHLTEATSRKGASGFMYNNLGTALEQLGKLDEARLAFESGGKLGSREAASSRKRLEGVKAIALAQPQPAHKAPAVEQTFSDTEGAQEPASQPAGSDAASDGSGVAPGGQSTPGTSGSASSNEE